MRLFCFGLGYTGLALARSFLTDGLAVAGTCRTPDKARELRAAGIDALVFDGVQPMARGRQVLAAASHLLVSVPPDRDGDPVLRRHGLDLQAVAGSLAWVGYLSSSGVYGDCGGAWIDETREPAPQTDDNRRRLVAERAWLAFGERTGTPVQVFRLPGIYGPDGRSAMDCLRSGRARRIVKAGQVFNRIHVDDLVAILRASMARPQAGRVYNIADDLPAPADEVLTFAAGLIGMEPSPEEPFETAGLTPFASHFYAESRRIGNARIKDELGVRLSYPSYREGLTAIAALGA